VAYRQDFSIGGLIEAPKAPRGWGAGRGCPPAHRGRGLGRRQLPRKVFDYLVLKWRILMHIQAF